MDIPLPGEDIPLPPPPSSQSAPMPPSVPLSNVPLPPAPYVGGLPRPPTFSRPPYIGVPPHVMGMPPPIFNRPPPSMPVGMAPPPAGPPPQHQQMTAPPSSDDSSRYSPSAAMFDSDSGGEDPAPVTCAAVTTVPPPPLPFLSANGAVLQPPPPVIDLDDDDVQVVPEAPPAAEPVDDGASNPNHVEVEQPAPPLTSVSQIKPETLRKLPPVLGREQAKKRLMAFSAMKLAKRTALAPKPTPKPAKPAKQVDPAGGGDDERRVKKRERSPLLIEKIMREEEELKEKLNLGPAAILVGNASSILSMVAMGRDTKPDPQYKPAERVVPADAEIMAAVSGEAALRSLPGGGGMTMATSGFGVFTTTESSVNKLVPAGKPKSRWDDQPPVAVSATAALTPLAAAAAAAAAALAARRSSRSRSKSRSSSRSRRRPRSPSPRRRPTKLPVDWNQFKTGGYEMDDIRLIRSDLMRRKRMSRRRQTRHRRRRHSSSRSRSRSSSRSGSRHSSPDAAESVDPLLQPEHEHRLISYVSIVGRSHALEFPREMIRETVAKPQLSYSESLHVFSRIKNRRQVLENVDEDRVQALRIWWSQLSVAPQQPEYPVLTKRRPWYSGDCQLPDVWPPLVDGETSQPQEETNGEDREASPMETDADRAGECHENGEHRQENNVKEVCEATSTGHIEVSSTDDARVQDPSDVPTSSEVYDPLEAGGLTPTTDDKTCEDVAPCVETLGRTEEASTNNTSVGDGTRGMDTKTEETPRKVDVSRESGGEDSQDEQVAFKKRKKKQSHSNKKSEGKRKKKKKRAKKEEVSESSEEEEEEESEGEDEDSAGEMVWVESTKIKHNSKKVSKDKKTRHKESKKDKKKKKKRKHETSEESESSEFDEEEEPEMPKSNYRNRTAKSSSEAESSDEEEERTPKKKKKKSKSKKKKKKRRRDDSTDEDDEEEERDDRGRGGGRSGRRSRSPDGGGRGDRRRDRSPPRRRRSPARSPPPRRRSPVRSPPPRRRSPARSPHRRRRHGDGAPSDCRAAGLQSFGPSLRGSPVATHGSRRARCG